MKFKEFIEKYQPSNWIGNQIATKKALKMTAKPDIINIIDDSARQQFLEFLNKNNWEMQKERSIFQKSYNGGVCLFLTQINDEWKLGHSIKVISVGRDITGKEQAITLLASVWKGNRGKYYLYETHTDKEIIRDAYTIPMDENGKEFTAQKVFDDKTNKTPWDSFLIDVKINLKQIIETNIQTAFLLNNKKLIDEDSPFGNPDVNLAENEIGMLDLAFESFAYTLRSNRSRLVIRRSAGAEIYGIDEEGDEVQGDEMLSGGLLVITDENGYESGSPVSIFDPNPETIRTTRAMFEKTFMDVMTRVGLANPDDSDSAQKTQLEISQIRDAEHSELEREIILTQTVLNNLMESIGKLLNINLGDEYGWDIQRLDVRQETQILADLEKMSQLGWITTEKAIANANNISISEAKAIVKQVKKEKKKAKDEAMENVILAPQEPSTDQELDQGVSNAKDE